MKKWSFWWLTFLGSLLHFAVMFQGTRQVFRVGMPGVENQTALLFIPFFWLLTAVVLVGLNLYTLILGVFYVKREDWVSPARLFRRGSSLPGKGGERMLFFTAAVQFLMAAVPFAARGDVWGALYLLTGGGLVLLWYLWLWAGGRKAVPFLQAVSVLMVCVVEIGLLTGCAAVGNLLGDVEDPDLVVYNDSTAVLGSISVSNGEESQTVSLADGSPLERGESYGFAVDHPGRVTVELWSLEGRRVGRCRVTLGEERLYVTLKEDGRLAASTAEPWRD